MNIKYVLEQDKVFTDVHEFINFVGGVASYSIGDYETGEIIVYDASVQDLAYFGDRSLRGVELMIVEGVICAFLYIPFYGDEADGFKNTETK
jgi:hypothetical protein